MPTYTYSFSVPAQFGSEHFVVSFTPNHPEQFVVYSDYLSHQIADISAAEKAQLYTDSETVYLIRELMSLQNVGPTLSDVERNTQGIIHNQALLSGLANAAATAVSAYAGNPFTLSSAIGDVLKEALQEGPNIALWSIGKTYADIAAARANTLFSTYLPPDWSVKEIDTSKIADAWNLAVDVFNLAGAAQTLMNQAADINKTAIQTLSDFLSDVTMGVINIPFKQYETADRFIDIGKQIFDTLQVSHDINDALSLLETLPPALSAIQLQS
ncbi:hypothetical protein ACVWW4_006595 [Bradyrhizobium sp. LB7.1]